MTLVTRIVALVCLTALLCPAAHASHTITLQQGLNGYGGCTDAWLDESATRTNHGGSSELQIQWNNGRSDCALIKFDLSGALPQGAVILSASLLLWYYEAGGMVNSNAVTIKPFRFQTGAWWDENTYDGVSGYGVSYRYRDANETYEWTGGAEGGWYDKIDDANGTVRIKKTGGTPQGAIEPLNWASFDVRNSVVQWKNGAANNGFLFAATGFEGSGSIAHGLFIARNNGGTYGPKLIINYDLPTPTVQSTWGRLRTLYR